MNSLTLGISNFLFSSPVQSSLFSVRFRAQTTTQEKVTRVCNMIIGGVSFYSVYALHTKSKTIIAYASYLALALVIRKIVEVILGIIVYRAILLSRFDKKEMELAFERQIKALENENFIIRRVKLSKSSVEYDGLIVTSPRVKNQNWVINSLGNGMSYEKWCYHLIKNNEHQDCHTLLINGPSVGSSKGWPTRYQMGAAFESGLQFLEQELKATKIIMKGFSLGGGMLSEAILGHDFSGGLKNKIQYLMISDRSFNYLSEVAASFVGKFAKYVFYLAGHQLDGVGAAKKLSSLDIPHIIIQHHSQTGFKSDGVIEDKVSLSNSLHQDTTLKNKIYLESNGIGHNNDLPLNISAQLDNHIKKFLV